MHPTTVRKVQNSVKANKLRRLARDRECQIRVPGVCCGDASTVVLCHLGGAGIARKHNDFTGGAWGCRTCHDAIDGRVKTPYPKEMLKLWHLEAVIRTQQILIDEGVLRV